jgi:hypothetical protein
MIMSAFWAWLINNWVKENGQCDEKEEERVLMRHGTLMPALSFKKTTKKKGQEKVSPFPFGLSAFLLLHVSSFSPSLSFSSSVYYNVKQYILFVL